MTAKAYHDKVASPLVGRLKDVIRSVLLQYISKTQELKAALEEANHSLDILSERLESSESRVRELCTVEKDYARLRRGLGENSASAIISVMTIKESIDQKKIITHENMR